MPNRNIVFTNDEYYHIYNRGVAKQNIFLSRAHYHRFTETLDYYLSSIIHISLSRYLNASQETQQMFRQLQSQSKQLVQIVAYCLMPNHFHLLLKQSKNNGISEYMRKISNSYTRFHNTTQVRVGPVFQGPFKSKHVRDNPQLIHVTKYIHLNPLSAGLVVKEELEKYAYSSYAQYTTSIPSNALVVEPSIVLDQFANAKAYKHFCLDGINFSDSLGQTEHLLIDNIL